LSVALRKAQGVESGRPERRLDINIWWGLQDGMVKREGQREPGVPTTAKYVLKRPVWLNKALQAHPDEINLGIHEIEDGDHTDM
jgi:hypothetical protein